MLVVLAPKAAASLANKPIYLFLINAVVRAVDTMTVVAVILLLLANAVSGVFYNRAPSQRRSYRHWQIRLPTRERHLF